MEAKSQALPWFSVFRDVLRSRTWANRHCIAYHCFRRRWGVLAIATNNMHQTPEHMGSWMSVYLSAVSCIT
ncbi:hypothetical protein HZ326_13997 [Fusarium oxysporum f. sp. albedinis]|nr:hypothetical protein HZ326_13997 [Fusarium oxysporum f. sp. albedinis]